MEIALGVLLGLLGVALAALAAYLVARRARPAPPAAGPDDDLPGFLETPPGTTAEPSPARGGWAALAPPPAPPATTRARTSDNRLALGAMAAVGVLLIALAVALVTGRAGSRHDAGGPAGGSVPVREEGVQARLTFGGVVLERHAVGVTATYPRLEVTSDGERSRAHLELPTFHCLTGEAPQDPVAAGCRRSGTEYADLGSPALTVSWSGERLRVSGDFPTYLRPTGGLPESTGRVYGVEVAATSANGVVEGSLDLGDERTTITPGRDVNVLRRPS